MRVIRCRKCCVIVMDAVAARSVGGTASAVLFAAIPAANSVFNEEVRDAQPNPRTVVRCAR